MTVTVVWYDGTEGSTWKLDYDAGTAVMKTALKLTGKGDKQWHHETVTVEKQILSMLAVLLALSGCVNVHVHFPAAPAVEIDVPAEEKKQP